MSKLNYGYYDSPLGLIEIIATDTAIIELSLDATKVVSDDNKSPIIKQCIAELQQYFNQTLKVFTVPLAFSGTPFQEAVWNQLAVMPYGTIMTYHELAKLVNYPKANRAVGTAVGKNPIAIIVPCHRIINQNKKIINYLYGKDKKLYLQKLEGITYHQ